MNPGELPSEFAVRPTTFVALTGLDVVHNAIHKSVWDTFVSNRRPDRVPIVFKVLDGDHEYPKGKSKRSSYDFYVPKGILKTNWVKKHLYLVPSLVVVFYDLDWDDPMWNEKKMECETKIEIVRAALDARDTKVALVLMQKNSIVPGDDGTTKAAAMSICSACDLSTNCLFVLPHTDHLHGYILRLENAFYDLAQNYYHLKIRTVKNHLDELKTTTHQLLFVRHHFKIGFFSELRQDITTALKHYKQAYSNLLEVRSGDTHVMEVKTIAGFLNYKICRLSFQMSIPLDAISQFRRHIDLNKSKVGPKELIFQHSAWMSKQFSIFGELFHEAITLGLSAIQVQHPGFYYQQAAYHSLTRKNQCHEICKDLKNQVYPENDPLAGVDNLEYFGQRPWRPAIQSIEPPNMDREREGILAIQFKESSSVTHSMLVITLLSSAVTQFKKYKCPRMKRFLLVQMGEEYYHLKDYERSLTLLTRVMWDYRWERWWNLLHGIQLMALRCAYLMANIQEYVTIMIEALSKCVPFKDHDKRRIQSNLVRVVLGEAPEPEPDCPLDSLNDAFQVWSNRKLSEIPQTITVEMNHIVSFVDCQAWFDSSEYQIDQFITVKSCIRVSCPIPISFSKLSVLFNNHHYNQHCIFANKNELMVESGQPKCHTFTFVAEPKDLHKKIEIVGFVLQLGDESSCSIALRWLLNGDSIEVKPLWTPWRDQTAFSFQNNLVQVNKTSCRVLPRDSRIRIAINHAPPALVNEWYPFHLVFTNNESFVAENVIVTMGLKEDQDLLLHQSTHFCLDVAGFDGNIVSKLENINLEKLDPGEEVSKIVFMKPLQVDVRPIFFKISYVVEVRVGSHSIHCACSKEEELMVPTVKAFDVTSRMMSMKFENLENSLSARNSFLMMQDIVCISPCSLTILTSSLELNNGVRTVDNLILSQVENVDLETGERASECVCLVPYKEIENPISIGKYKLTWKRMICDVNIPPVETVINLPEITVTDPAFYIDVSLPANGIMRTPLMATYTIYNYTKSVCEFFLIMEASDAFMFSGQKQLRCRLMPQGKHEVKYNLYPLVAGYVALPRLKLSLTDGNIFQSLLDAAVETHVPTHIFILPQGKALGDINQINIKCV
uniref:Trafficking protein particle complex subunit 11 n=1 Tax=Strigamia maritima TaxID=126957 RepID=T1IXF1_STRMM